VASICAVCGADDAEPLGVGEDFEYRTSPDSFLAVQCRVCGLVYLDRRPAESEHARIYPDDYHAYDFSAERFGLVYQVRRRLEAHRLLKVAEGLPADARIVDVGCGDGFHLSLLAEFGEPGWRLEGIDPDPRAAARGEELGLTIHTGTVEDVELDDAGYDLALLIMTIEHVADPASVLEGVRRVVKPGGRLLIITDNTGSPDFRLFRRRHWGGYHFPRHFNLFNRSSLRRLATRTGWDVAELATIASPVNWVYSVRNTLDDWGAPKGLVDQFSLESAPSLAAFTAFDAALRVTGRGAVLRAVLQRPTGGHA
jgi:SAM-dependent methyltransferase